jgi:hypothetical protein
MADFGDWGEVATPKGNLLKYIKKGVLWLEKKPYYIVELIKEENLAYVMVYKVHPGTEDNPQKLAQEITATQQRFSSNTRLGQLANNLFPTKATKKWIPYDPVFIAPVVPSRPNTFTGKFEEGFYEREEDRVAVQGGEKIVIRGKNTGVFIGLSSINWEPKVTIPTDSLVKTLKEYERSSFFDLDGNNADKSNPLSTYYRGE